MKKITALFCIFALLAALMAGCGTSAPQQTTAPETTETTPETSETEASSDAVTIRIGALTGPTAMGMVKLFKAADNGEAAGNYTYFLGGTADELTPMIASGQLDIAAVPANLAAVLYSKPELDIQVIAVNVLGVLYIGEYNTNEIQSVTDLKGKTIYATGKGSTPEYFLRYVLTGNGLDPDTDVTIEWKSNPNEIVSLMAESQEQMICMLPQPAVTAAGIQLGENFHIALSVSEEWDKLGSGSQCTTAVIIAVGNFAAEHPEAVEGFLKEFAASAEWVNANVPEAAALCEEYGIAKAGPAQKAIPNCNIVCLTGNEMRAALEGCLSVIFEQAPKAVGGSMPGDDFYYGAQ